MTKAVATSLPAFHLAKLDHKAADDQVRKQLDDRLLQYVACVLGIWIRSPSNRSPEKVAPQRSCTCCVPLPTPAQLQPSTVGILQLDGMETLRVVSLFLYTPCDMLKMVPTRSTDVRFLAPEGIP